MKRSKKVNKLYVFSLIFNPKSSLFADTIHEIEENGDFYRDPEVPDGQPTYQYCAVKVDKELPSGVENERLAELFVPDE